MKIAFVSQAWNFVGLSERNNSIVIWLEEMARALARNHEVLVYSRGGRGIPPRAEDQGIHHRRFRTGIERRWHDLIQGLSRAGRDPVFARPSFYRHYLRRIAADLRREKPDLVHVMNFGQFLPSLRRSLPAARLVLHMHCEWLSTLPRRLVAPWLESADLVLFCSEYLRQRAIQAWPEAAPKFHCVPNGVDMDLFRAVEPRTTIAPRLLFVGRISPEKGVHDLLQAMQLVLERHPAAKLQLVGPLGLPSAHFLDSLGPPEVVDRLRPLWNPNYPKRIRDHIAELGIDSVELPGPEPHRALPRILANADLLVNPSHSESFGMSLIEALAVGRRVVATRVGGQIEILEGCPLGTLVSPAWPEELGRGILRALAGPPCSPEERQTVRERIAECYSWPSVRDQLLAAYATLPGPTRK